MNNKSLRSMIKAQILEVLNEQDQVTLDIPLLIRLLELAREELTDDMQIHSLTERLIALSKNGKTLTMKDYNNIISSISTTKK